MPGSDKIDAIRVGILGLGTVGAGTINVLARNADVISGRAGRAIEVVVGCARDLSKPRDCPTDGFRLTDDALSVASDPNVDVLVELIGGTDLARQAVLSAIKQGKHVVTANKALIALHGNEIFEAAEAAGVVVGYESAVAGGIPIIKAIREGLAGNRIDWLAGIINGTGNFILSEMQAAGRDFGDVLAEAQALGYAEADPTFDVEGIDAAHKLAILSSIAFGHTLRFDDVYVEGITQLTAQDIEYADQLGYRIKHLGIARGSADGIEMRVHPTLIPKRRLLASVDGVLNAVMVHGNAVGPTMYSGPGAGALPTASAVVADLVDVARAASGAGDSGPARVPALAFHPDAVSDQPSIPMEAVVTGYYLRMLASDQPGVLADVANILGAQGISIEAVMQHEPAPDETRVDLIMLTHRVTEGRMNQALAEIEKLSSIHGSVARVRVEHLGTD